MEGYKNTGLRINNYFILNQVKCWTEEELEKRSAFLKEEALKIWPMPESKFVPEKKLEEKYDLADEDDMTDKKIVNFTFRNYQNQPVKNWTDMFIKVVQALYEEDKSPIIQMATDPENANLRRPLFTTNPNDIASKTKSKNYHKLDKNDEIYVCTYTDTPRKLTILAQLFEKYDIEPSDLCFCIAGNDAKDENGEY